ncbi:MULTISPECIES: long-chain fatty acid--CoA ligase [Sphingobium]|uniref:long-chain fatty acid--CoA ligase n=1 Tax=Sphingobium TaxID=165695 RepID=UPI00159BF38D|nr:long-chain fatty acid--CoA ligase [Sphingobium sp. 15-1]
MIEGLMQRTPLMIGDILRHCATAHGDREIVSRLVGEPAWRYDNRGLRRRAGQAVLALARRGIRPGDRVASLAWNTHRHLELFYAVPGMGAVLHTVNPRFSDDQIVYTINHAGSRLLFVDRSFLPLVHRLRDRISAVEAVILLASAPDEGFESYEELIAGEADGYDWPSFDENSAAVLCYTSGTTGDPKGVLYSHRSIVLHALANGLPGALGLSAFDCIMPCVPMYHATAWGMPYMAAISGCKLALPCDRMDGESLHSLIRDEGVTFSGGVPTVWTMYLDHLARTGEDSGTLDRIMIGGSAVPRAMAETFERRHGVKVRQVWGMTELSPLGVISTPTPQIAHLGQEAEEEILWTRQGRAQFGVELRIVGEDGAALPHDGATPGALQARGPWTVQRYFRSEKDATSDDRWFDTGDIATIDEHGFLRITDRSKDVIKSGGEWISSIDIENVAAACAGVKVAAVIGVRHPQWEERPILIIEGHDGAQLQEQVILDHLASQIAKWWMPDKVIFAPVPLTATGKIDKKRLRENFADELSPI